MAKLRHLLEKDFVKLLSNYNIGEYRKHKRIEYTLENSNYFLTTTEGKFFLKIFERSKEFDVKKMVRIENYLHSKKVKVPKILKTRKNSRISTFRQKPIVIYEFLDGIQTKKLSKKLTMDLANKIGILHNNLLTLKMRYTRNWPLPKQFIDTMTSIPNPFVKSQRKALQSELREIKYNKLRMSMTHGDLFHYNFLVKKDKLIAFIDWDDSHYDYLVFDLAILLGNTFMSYKRIKKDKIKLFMKHYSKHVKLNNEEKKAIYRFIKVRLVGILLWHESKKKQHPDKLKQINRTISNSTEQYKMLSRLPLATFLDILG